MSGKRRLPLVAWMLCALFAALIAIGAFIKIPLNIIPMTLQVLFVILAGSLLGAKLGALSVCVYMVLGLVGVPVFTNGGGIGYVLQPTFGYIIGFACGAALCGYLVRKSRPRFWRCLLAGLAGVGVIYAFGLVYCYVISNYVLNVPLGAWPLFLSGCLLVLPGDIISCVLCALLAVRLSPVTHSVIPEALL